MLKRWRRRLRPIRRVNVELPLAGLSSPRSCDFMSDMHIRDTEDLDRFVAATRQPGSDTLLLGGDYCEKERFIEPLFRHFVALYPKIYAVLGNNDKGLVEPRVKFLQDEIVNWDGINLLGTKDPARDHPLPPRLPADPLLVLSHSPDILLDLPVDRSLVVIAGHVHGGQFRIPGLPLLWSHTRIGRKYGEGHSRRGKNEIFVGRGIGYSVLPLRNVPPEVYTITFQPV